MVELKQTREQRHVRHRPLIRQPLGHLKNHRTLPRRRHRRQIEVLIIGDLKHLPLFHPEHPNQMLRRVAGQLGLLAPHLGNIE